MKAMRSAGIHVVESPAMIGETVAKVLAKKKTPAKKKKVAAKPKKKAAVKKKRK